MLRFASCAISMFLVVHAAGQPPAELSAYDVTWATAGPDASASMPIGNGELGMNLWTQPNGDLSFYLSRTDSWSEASRLMKLARVHVAFEPPIVQEGRSFSQQLDLARGVIRVSSTAAGDSCDIEVFVHPDEPVAFITGTSDTPRYVKVTLDPWRTERTRLTGTGADAELTSSWTMHDAPASVEVWESADRVLEDPTRIVWAHRNEDSVVPMTIRHQGLESIAASIPDVLMHRTFGGAIVAERASDFRKVSMTTIESNAALQQFQVRVVGHTGQTETMEKWLAQVDAIAGRTGDVDAARARVHAYWNEFWNRSYIFVEGDADPGTPVNAHPITFGQDSNGGDRFHGVLHRAGMYAKPFDDRRMLLLGQGGRDRPPPFPRERVVSFVSGDEPGKVAPGSAARQFPDGFTVEACIQPSGDLKAARIIDKVTAGRPDGFLFDIQPGGTLRLVVGDKTLTAPGRVKLGSWNRVGATYDPKLDQLRLFVEGREVAASARRENAMGSRVTRGYVLQRWIQACGGRGNAPIKFNGSIFTVDARFTNDGRTSPDFRRWGDCYWWQNTRLPYHPMLASGDFEMMDPLFKLFTDVLPANEARTALYHGAKGAYFVETMNVFGLPSNGDYGWSRDGHEANELLCPWWQWAWNQGPELVALMLDRYDYTQDEAFARETVAPMARAVLLYFDTRFKRDERGTLVVSPTQALETHWNNVVNDMPVVAGLHDVTARLIALPDSVGDTSDRALWKRVRESLPPLPVREVEGVKMYSPAERYDPARKNVETPELANVFPHRLVGIGSPATELEMAREAYKRRFDKATHGWTQDGQFAALLGLTDEAKSNILAKARNSNSRHRFPAMWGPNFDWVPDQCHGSNLMHVLQTMLLQARGDKVLVLPAWPREWDVSFKLHAPRETVIECDYRDGTVTRLEVWPESRRADVEVMLGGE